MNLAGQLRLESEYKLSIPETDVDLVESFFAEEFSTNSFAIDSFQLDIDHAEEVFVDSYFDDTAFTLLNQNIGLRHRLRYSQDVLVNELVQIKLPESNDGLVRREIKYKVPNKVSALDELSGHPVLQFVDAADRDHISYQLRQCGVGIKDVQEQVSLTQKRNRIYLADAKGSVATLSLDHVTNNRIPYQEFYELEIEINEIRFTEAAADERAYLIRINELIKHKVKSRLPSLTVDQTPKYNKLKLIIEYSLGSKIVDYGIWFVYGFVICIAGAKLTQL